MKDYTYTYKANIVLQYEGNISDYYNIQKQHPFFLKSKLAFYLNILPR